MVIERLLSVKAASQNLVWVFVASGFISLFSVAISLLIFESTVGLFTTILITLASLPFMHNLLKAEEAKQEEVWIRKLNLFQRHRRIIEIYIAFFLGIIMTLSILFVMLPPQISEKIFREQIKEIEIIRGRFIFPPIFRLIVLNNLTVFALSFLLAFLLAAGAIFILAWNATVLSAAIGLAAKNITGLPAALLTFFPHASLEFLAYFFAVISGGILSAMITRRKSKQFQFVIQDCCTLLFIGILLILVAAVVEVIALL